MERLCTPALLALATVLSQPAAAQDTTSFKEQYRLIKAPDAVQPLHADLFGDQVNLYTGRLEFVQSDVSLPGNNRLRVAVGRSLTTGEDNYGKRAFGHWHLDLPHLHGIFSANTVAPANTRGWVSYVGGGSYARCTNFGPPPETAGTNSSYWAASEFWTGNFIYVPGQGDQLLLSRAAENTRKPSDGLAYPIVTNKGWAITCENTPLQHGSGEGFLAVAPDGTRYRFDWMVDFPMAALTKNTTAPIELAAAEPSPDTAAATPVPEASANARLLRSEVWILPTLVTDRYGNTVTYTYDPAHPTRLTRISSSDGRTLALGYVSGDDMVRTVSDGYRTWTYNYDTGGTYPQRLTSIVLPDRSSWDLSGIYNLLQVVAPILPGSCDAPATFQSGSAIGGSMVSPSGARATYTLTPTTHARTGVPHTCLNDGTGHYYPREPRYFYTYSLTRKDIAGAALAGMTWSYQYQAPPASWSDECGSVDCDAPASTTVTDPEGNFTWSDFGARFGRTDGLPMRTTIGSSQGTARQTDLTYMQWNASLPYPQFAGYPDPTDIGSAGTQAKYLPIQAQVIWQQGASFVWQVSNFDALARPRTVQRFRSLGPARTETTSYFDFTAKWVLGQIADVVEPSTGKTMLHHDFDAAGNVRSTSRFGHVDETATYNADGTLATRADGAGHTTRYANYKAGIAQDVQYGDGSAEHAVVKAYGYVESVTNAAGYMTSFGYDAMGRLASIDYPAADSVGWYQTRIAFNYITGAEFGVPAGHWRQIVDTGPAGGRLARAVTVYDALLRPVVSRRSDTGADGNTSSAVLRNFDSAGRAIFASYAARDASFTADPYSRPYGTTTIFDALGRVTDVAADTELSSGKAHVSTSYDNGFVTTTTDARGAVTLAYARAFDDPDAGFPMTVYPPGGVKLEWTRDVFGKPRSLMRSGKDLNGANISATRSYIYDTNERLCKTLEPETGATVVDYDGANNLAWRATGTNLSRQASCDRASVSAADKISFSYNVHNQLLNTSFGDGSPGIARTYTPDGLL